VVAPETVDMEYVLPVEPEQTLVFPVIDPVVPKEVPILTALQDADEVAQPLPAVTQTFPEVLPDVRVTEVVPCPEVIVHPDGTDQV
jgi:hypothetical protein